MKKQSLSIVLILIVAILATVVGIGFDKQKPMSKQEVLTNTIKEKREELNNAKGGYAPDSIVLQNTDKNTASSVANAIGADLRMTADESYAVLYLPEGTTIDDIYENEEYEMYIPLMDPDYVVSTTAVDALNHDLVSERPNYNVYDGNYVQQDYLDYVNLKDTWMYTKGQGVTVAIIDTGIDTDNSEFEGRISDRSYNASEDKVVADYDISVIEDEQGHGTSVAGVLAAGMDGSGIVGIAPEAELLVIKCECDSNGEFTRGSDLVFGLAYAIECNVDVVNMSFGTSENVYSHYTSLAVDSDIICVAASGNDGSSIPQYPAADENVIAVGALDTDTWEIAEYSNYGNNMLMAPGTTYTTKIGGLYSTSTGTSLASPMVAGSIALYISNAGGAPSFDEVCKVIKASSHDLGIPGKDRTYGFGELDIYALVREDRCEIVYDTLTDEIDNITDILIKGHTIQEMPEIERNDVVLDGWYYDEMLENPCAYYEDIFNESLSLYAGWITEDDSTCFTYRNIDDNSCELVSYSGHRRYVSVPSEYEGKEVVSISEGAFLENDRLVSVTLPDSIIEIGANAFGGCSNLRSMVIPSSVEKIEEKAFYDCCNLSNLVYENGSSLISIGNQAFAHTGLTTVNIPRELETIGKQVFFGSSNIKQIVVDSSNRSFELYNNALYTSDKDTLVYYPSNLRGEYTVAEGTKSIADSAFAYSKITNIVLPSSLENIGDNSFTHSKLNTLSIPNSVKTLGIGMCQDAQYLESVVFENGISIPSIPVQAFSGAFMLGEIDIPNSVNVICKYAFADSGLSIVSFQNESTLKTIDDNAFSGALLDSIAFPASLETISDSAFAYCSNLENVEWDVNSCCTNIGVSAFAYDANIENVDFPSNLICIDKNAFLGTGLSEISIGASVETIGVGAFADCDNLCVINIDSQNSNYRSIDNVIYSNDCKTLHTYPAGLQNDFNIPSGVEIIEDYAFYGANLLGRVTFCDSVKTIGAFAFDDCRSLQTPALPESLIAIEESAFENCFSFTGEFLIPKTVIDIERYAFHGDINLSQISFESDSVISRLGYGVFAGSGIYFVTIPENVTSIGQYLFDGCTNLITVTFEGESQLEYIPAYTFSGAKALRQVTFEDDNALTLIEARAFENLPMLTRVTLEKCSNLKTIDNYAFRNCPMLESIQLPEGLKELGRNSFEKCSSLSEITIPNTVECIKQYAFKGTNNINVLFKATTLPLNLETNWDFDVANYYVGAKDTIQSGDFSYVLSADRKASLVGYTGTDENLILSKIDGYDIVSIGASVFENNTTLKQIELPDTLNGIYKAAFKNTSALESIIIPKSVQIIDTEAFYNSSIRTIEFEDDSELVIIGAYSFAETDNIEAFDVPSSVANIKDYAFYKSSVNSVIFDDDSALSEIGRYAFSNSSVSSVSLPNSLEKIDFYAFSNCQNLEQISFGNPSNLKINGHAFYESGLTSVNVPSGVTYIGELCFVGCENLESIAVSNDNNAYSTLDGILYNKNATKLICCPAAKTGEINIPNTVSSLDISAFENSKLSSVQFSNDSNLATISNRAFLGCKNLEEISLSKGITTVGSYAFAYCDNLSAVNIPIDNKLSYIANSAFYNDAKLVEINLSDSIQEIGNYAFYGCIGLTSTGIPTSSDLVVVGNHAYEYTGITSFGCPVRLIEIGDYAFNETELSSVEFNDELLMIGTFAFANCNLSNEFNIPNSVEYIGSSALLNAEIKELTIPFLGDSANANESNAKLAYIFGMYNISSNETLETVTVLRGNLGKSAFQDFHMLTNAILPNSITEIPSSAFWCCYALKNIDIPEGVTKIGMQAFTYSGLEEVVLPNSLETIESNAFRDTDLKSVKIPKNVSCIEDGAFGECNDLKNVDVDVDNKYYAEVDGLLIGINDKSIVWVSKDLTGELVVPDGVRTIGNGLFENANISKVVIPNTVISIGAYAFCGCDDLEEIVFLPGDETCSMLGFVFSGCTSLKSIELANRIEIIESNMFASCTSLESIEVPDSVEEIRDKAFADCSSLKNIYINKASFDASAFNDCLALETITVSEDSEYYTVKDNVIYSLDQTSLAFVPRGNSGDVIIPSGVISIGADAFNSCINITSVTLPDSVENIGDTAFAYCENLSEVLGGNSLKYVGSNPFYETAWEMNGDYIDGVLYLGNCAITSDKSATTIVVKDGTTSIASGCFSSASATHIYIPDSVKYVGNRAFAYCNNLVNLRISKNIDAFSDILYNCSSIRSLNISSENASAIYLDEMSNLQYFNGGTNGDAYDFFSVMGVYNIDTVAIPYSNNARCDAIFAGNQPNKIILTTTDEMDNSFFSGTYGAIIYCNVNGDKWDDGWQGENTVYYKDEWHLATFMVDDVIVTMTPLLNGELVQRPSQTLVDEYLWPGSSFAGWDINGDGKVDSIPSSLDEDLVAVAVYESPITSIAINCDDSMEVTDEQTATLQITPWNYTESDEVIWSSSDESILEVNDGVIVAKSEGTAIITATLVSNESIASSVEIEVSPLTLGIRLEETSGEIVLGDILQLTPRFIFAEDDTDETVWESSNEDVATVTSDGLIRAVAPGTAVITICHGEYEASFTVSVVVPLESISIGGANVVNVGESVDLIVNYLPTNTTEKGKAIWSSSNSEIAKVNANGVVEGVAPGTTTITAKVGDKIATYDVEVKVPIKWIVLNTTTGTMRLDRTKQLEVIYEPSNTTDDKTVVWSSLNPLVASVSDEGVVTALDRGTAVITGTVGDFSATYTVTVISLRDPVTGVTVTKSDDTAMADDISLKVDAISDLDASVDFAESLEKIDNEMKDSDGYISQSDVFDISLLKDNATVQPDGSVDVDIPMPMDFDTDSVKVYRIEDTGEITDMDAKVEDGKVSFTTEHFSIYAVCSKTKETYPVSIELDTSSIELCVDDEMTLVATISPNTVDHGNLIWSSSNEDVVSVDNGIISAVAEGSAIISVKTENGLIANCTVIVSNYDEDDGIFVRNSGLTVSSGILYGINGCIDNEGGMTVSTLVSKFRTPSDNVIVKDTLGNVCMPDSIVGTGYTVTLVDELGAELDTLIVAVKGDINGDGLANNRDIIIMRQYVLSMILDINNVQINAVDLFEDGRLNNRDISYLMRVLVGKEVL